MGDTLNKTVNKVNRLVNTAIGENPYQSDQQEDHGMSQLQESIYINRRRRMRAVLEDSGGTVAFAKRMGFTKSYASRILGEGAKVNISERLARRVEVEFSLPVGILDTPVETFGAAPTGVITIKLLQHSRSLKPESERETPVHELTVSRSWLRTNVDSSDHEALAIAHMKGDEMSPSFPNGSILLVDRNVTSISSEGVYCLGFGGEMFVRRVQRKVTGGLLLISDNAAYKSEEVSQSERESMRVHGKVVAGWVLNKP